MSNNTKRLTNEEFIEKAKLVHGDKYNYSKVNYINNNTKVQIICPIHGEFCQRPKDHLKGQGCIRCSGKERKTTESFIEQAKNIHGDKYDYSLINYTTIMSKVRITCPVHGEFLQVASKHLCGQGCPFCRKNKKDTTESFIEKAKHVHGDKFNYSNTVYLNNWTKLSIICPIHGEFLQTPNDHLDGCGCPKCNRSHNERLISKLLTDNNIRFEEQKTWDWLIYKSNQHADFYLPDYNCIIECQGIQHFEEIKFFDKYTLKERLEMDKNKLDLCTKNGIKVLYYSNLGENYNYPYEVFTDPQILINEIKKISLTN